jgi:hypothetical protein
MASDNETQMMVDGEDEQTTCSISTRIQHLYAVVEFLSKECVELVAGKWLFTCGESGQLKTYWPPRKCSATQIRGMCLGQEEPNKARWTAHAVRTFYVGGMYNYVFLS